MLEKANILVVDDEVGPKQTEEEGEDPTYRERITP